MIITLNHYTKEHKEHDHLNRKVSLTRARSELYTLVLVELAAPAQPSFKRGKHHFVPETLTGHVVLINSSLRLN